MATIDTIADRSNGSEVAGKMYFETSTNKLIAYNGSIWIELDSDGTGAVPFENRWGASFDGSSDYLDIGTVSALNSTTSFTISMWINFENVTGSVVMSPFTSGTSTNNRVEFVFNNINELRFGVNGSVNNCTFDISSYRSTNAWHNIVGTFDGSNVTLFFDGSQVSTTTSSVPSSTSSTHGNDTTVGRRTLGGGSLYFNGLIDDVAIFSSALDQTAVTELYNGGTPSIVSGSSGWWRMGDNSNDSATSGGSIASITDSSGNGNSATQSTASDQPTFSELQQSTTSLNFVRSSSQYMEKDFASVVGATAFTFGLWYKAGSYASYQALLEYADSLNGYPDGWRMMLNSNNELKFWYGTPSYHTPLYMSPNIADAYDWNYIVVTRSSAGDMSLYYNGNTTAVDTGTYTSVSGVTATHLRVAGTNWPYDGKIDEVSFFNSELTGSDLTTLIGASRSDHVKNDLGLSPLAYWRMGEDDSLTAGALASQITDASGNGNHLTQSTASNQPTASISSTIYV